MEGAEYIPLGFLGVIHRGSGSVTFQEHDCRLARGWLEAVTLLYERCELSHPASDTRGFSCRINGRREPRSSVDARINIAGCVRPNREKSPPRNNNTTIVVSRPSSSYILRWKYTNLLRDRSRTGGSLRTIRTEEEGEEGESGVNGWITRANFTPPPFRAVG